MVSAMVMDPLWINHMEDTTNTLLMIYVAMMIPVAGMLLIVLKKK